MIKKSVSYHLYTIKELIESTHIAPFQRIEDKEHVDTIFTGISTYYQSFHELFLPNIISIAIVKNSTNNYVNDNKYIVLDGQHRLQALILLINQYPETLNFKIRTDVYDVDTYEEAREVYTIINSSKKVELYTGNLEPYIIPKIQRYFLETFGSYCKTTQNPRGVNINIDTLIKKLQGYNFISVLGINLDNIDLWIQRIQSLNQYYMSQTTGTLCSYGIKNSLIQEVRSKNTTFYLGLFRRYEWIERILEYDTREYEHQDHTIRDVYIKTSRKIIPRRIRNKVWDKHFKTKLVGECFCCGKELNIQEFDCGHVVPVSQGGSNAIDNLEPICRMCNLDMGVMNLYSYKRLFSS